MLHKYVTQTSQTCDTEKLENALVSACSGGLQITHRLELRRLVTSLWHDAEMKKQSTSYQNHVEPLKALTNFKANLQRRKKASDTLSSSRLMKITEPALAILLSDIANTFRDETDDFTQIDFGNAKHVELLKAAIEYHIPIMT